MRVQTRIILLLFILGSVLGGCGGGNGGGLPASPPPTLPPASGASNPTTINSYPVSFKEFPIPAGQLTTPWITVGPDGSVWFSTSTGIDSLNGFGTVHSYADPILTSYGSIAGAADGLHFIGDCRNVGGFFATDLFFLTTSGVFSVQHTSECTDYMPSFIRYVRVKSLSGGGWVALYNAVGVADIANVAGTFNAQLGFNELASELTGAPDGNLYVFATTEYDPPRLVIHQVRRNQREPSQQFYLPTTLQTVSDMAGGSDGNLWLLDSARNVIARVSTAGTGYMEFPVPTANAGLSQIVAAPDGALYFTESAAGKIGRITTDGHITEFVTPSAGPTGITVCPSLCEGAHVRLFVTEAGSKILRFQY